MKVCVAVVRLVIDTEDEDGACEAISGLLTENMKKYNPECSLIDWQYEETDHNKDGLCFPRRAEAEDPFIPDVSLVPPYPLKEDDHA